MPSVFAEIRQWAETLPFWEQAALDKMLAGRQLDDSDYDKLLQYLLEDNGLAEPVDKRQKLQFNNSSGNVFQSSARQSQLVKISNIQNVNALVLHKFSLAER